ncbi:MAG: zf-HC2 domain-containing protein [Nitrospirota bacterium]|nr:zf-HC2 domain-containing protein [Nitrospirota bacterium]
MNRDAIKRSLADSFSGGMTCQAFVEAVTEYLEDTLSWSDWVRFQMHLGVCVGCRRYLSQMKQTVQTLGHLPHEPVPLTVLNELIARFRTWKNESTQLH